MTTKAKKIVVLLVFVLLIGVLPLASGAIGNTWLAASLLADDKEASGLFSIMGFLHTTGWTIFLAAVGAHPLAGALVISVWGA